MMLSKWTQNGCLFLVLFLLSACSEREGLAPVVELKWHALNTHAKQHLVVRGETLYAIAFRYDQDYRQLAALNHLNSPYTLRVGQVLFLQSNGSRPIYRAKPAYTRPLHRTEQIRDPIIPQRDLRWLWPIEGRVIASYLPDQGKKGINIAGKRGDRIRAAKGGIVAYAGNGLVGYGNLIIIKHDHQYLTAYGNNSRNLVREGQFVKAGQDIAEIGLVDRHQWAVHFEIRRRGKPINPMNYLQKG